MTMTPRSSITREGVLELYHLCGEGSDRHYKRMDYSEAIPALLNPGMNCLLRTVLRTVLNKQFIPQISNAAIPSVDLRPLQRCLWKKRVWLHLEMNVGLRAARSTEHSSQPPLLFQSRTVPAHSFITVNPEDASI